MVYSYFVFVFCVWVGGRFLCQSQNIP